MEEILNLLSKGFTAFIDTVNPLFFFSYVLIVWLSIVVLKAKNILPKIQTRIKPEYIYAGTVVWFAPLFYWCVMSFQDGTIRQKVYSLFISYLLAIFVEFVIGINTLMNKWFKIRFTDTNNQSDITNNETK